MTGLCALTVEAAAKMGMPYCGLTVGTSTTGGSMLAAKWYLVLHVIFTCPVHCSDPTHEIRFEVPSIAGLPPQQVCEELKERITQYTPECWAEAQ